MLQRLRSRPRFSALITAVFALLLLVASLAGVQVRVLAQPMAAALAADVCSVNAPALDLALAHADHAASDDLAPEGSDSHAGHAAHGADCVLCIAMALPQAFAADVHRPAAPPSASSGRRRLRTPPSAGRAAARARPTTACLAQSCRSDPACHSPRTLMR